MLTNDRQLTHFVQRLMAEFCKRWKDEQQPNCKTPVVGFYYFS